MKKNNLIDDVFEVLQFEYWLRFYFLTEEDGDFYVRLSDKQLQGLGKEYPDLVPLAQDMNATELTPEISQKLVITFLHKSLDGTRYKAGEIEKVLDMQGFKQLLHLFNVWVSLHESQLDENPSAFHQWRELFHQWYNSDAGKKVLDSMKMQGGTANSNSSQSVN